MTDLNTTFLLNGGAGRIITAIPALEKFHKLNPDDDFKIVVAGWESIFWSHPTLAKRVLGAHQKDLFNSVIKKSKVRAPEPYHNHYFFNQKINLVQAFDQEINETDMHADLNYSCLYLSRYEIEKFKEIIEEYKNVKKKRKVLVFQPFGSMTEIVNGMPIDRSNRSFHLKDYFKIVQSLANDAVVLYASMPEFRHTKDSFSISFDEYQPYLRALMGMIYHCDYFVGCCSVGQHIARAFDKPGMTVMGGTSDKNYSYPDHFTIYRKPNTEHTYIPWRLSDIDSDMADRANDGLMTFNDKEIKDIIGIIKDNISDLTVKKIGNTELRYD